MSKNNNNKKNQKRSWPDAIEALPQGSGIWAKKGSEECLNLEKKEDRDLLKQASQKLVQKSNKAGALRNSYVKRKKIENIYIPLNSLQELLETLQWNLGREDQLSRKKA